MEFDLPAEIDRLRGETTWDSGQNSRTLVKYEDLRVVLIVLQTHSRMAEHKSEGRISVHVLAGHVQVKAAGRTFNLAGSENSDTNSSGNSGTTGRRRRR